MNDSSPRFEIHYSVETNGESAVTVLSAASGLSKQKTKKVMQNGAVWLSRHNNTRRLRRAKKELTIGDELHLYYDATIQAIKPEAPTFIADEMNFSVMFKPPGMFSQGTKWGDHCAINRWLEQHLDRPTFVVHRLDKAASGLMILAHTKKAAAALSALFQQRRIQKHYRVLVRGGFSESPVLLDSEIDGRDARSRASLIKYNGEANTSLLKVDIETGRKHQIRRHLSEVGHPVIGDRLYGQAGKGNEEPNGRAENLQLMAIGLSFEDPGTGEQRDFSVPDALIPESMKYD